MATAKKTDALEVKPDSALAIYDYGDQAGAGWEETDADDFSVPFIKQMQSMSPEVDQTEGTYVEGAKPGLFYNTATKELMESFEFIVAKREHIFIEWVPDNGGFVGIHQKDSAVVAEATANAVDRNKLVTPLGNQLIDTFQLYLGILNADGTDVEDFAIMSFTSTKQKPYRDMMTRLRTLKGSKNIPLFAHRSKMVPVKQQNKKGEKFFNVSLEPMLGSTQESLLDPNNAVHRGILEKAQAFVESLATGERTVKYEAPTASGESTDEVF